MMRMMGRVMVMAMVEVVVVMVMGGGVLTDM